VPRVTRAIIDRPKSVGSVPLRMLAGAQQEGIQMRSLTASVCALAAAPPVAEAQNYRPWCAPNQFGGVMCSVDTKEQCMAALSGGGGGVCRENPAPRPPDPPAAAAAEAPGAAPEHPDDGYRAWCAPDQNGALTSSFDSQDQCLRSVRGTGAGGCRPNPAPRPTAGQPRSTAQAGAGTPVRGSSDRVIGVDPDSRIRTYMQRDGVGAEGVSGVSGGGT
jgi:hypothetical protein